LWWAGQAVAAGGGGDGLRCLGRMRRCAQAHAMHRASEGARRGDGADEQAQEERKREASGRSGRRHGNGFGSGHEASGKARRKDRRLVPHRQPRLLLPGPQALQDRGDHAERVGLGALAKNKILNRQRFSTRGV
jgi:hypothetical protein